jgi:hypothetical protein
VDTLSMPQKAFRNLKKFEIGIKHQNQHIVTLKEKKV